MGDAEWYNIQYDIFVIYIVQHNLTRITTIVKLTKVYAFKSSSFITIIENMHENQSK